MSWNGARREFLTVLSAVHVVALQVEGFLRSRTVHGALKSWRRNAVNLYEPV